MLSLAFRAHAIIAVLAFASGVPQPAHAQLASLASSAPVWTGSAKCQVDVDGGENYNDHQLHTWTIKSGTSPVREGAFQVHEATWSVTGRGYKAVAGSAPSVGGLYPTVNRSTWTHDIREVSAPIAIFVRASDQRLSVVARHAQLNVPKGAAGEETYRWQNGNPVCGSNWFCSQQAAPPQPLAFTVYEFQFPRIEDAITSTHLTGWTTPMPVTGSVFPLQPSGATGLVTCTWDFSSASLNPTLQVTPASPTMTGRPPTRRP